MYCLHKKKNALSFCGLDQAVSGLDKAVTDEAVPTADCKRKLGLDLTLNQIRTPMKINLKLQIRNEPCEGCVQLNINLNNKETSQ